MSPFNCGEVQRTMYWWCLESLSSNGWWFTASLKTNDDCVIIPATSELSSQRGQRIKSALLNISRVFGEHSEIRSFRTDMSYTLNNWIQTVISTALLILMQIFTLTDIHTQTYTHARTHTCMHSRVHIVLIVNRIWTGSHDDNTFAWQECMEVTKI